MGDKNNNFSAMKVLAIILLVIVVLAILHYTIVDGIVGIIKGFFNQIAGVVQEGVETAWATLKNFLGINTVKNGLYIYSINSEQVTALKNELESKGVATDTDGITETLLRKVLLAQAVTSSTQNTLCVADIEEEELLKDTEYSSLSDYKSACTTKKSEDVFGIKKFTDSNGDSFTANYTLYYITDYFFFFEDSKNVVGQGEDKLYLGVMGMITIETEDGEELKYVSNSTFESYKQKFEEDPSDSDKRSNLLHCYTIDDSGEMVVYKIIQNKNSYKYKSTRNGEKLVFKGPIQDGNSTYSVIKENLTPQNAADSSKYAVSIELLMHFLDMTGSPEYVDEFIDYALENTKVTLKGYSVNNTQVSYKKNTYNIRDKFIFELYDMVNGVDSGNDNMSTYRSLIYDRIYKGKDGRGSGTYFLGSVVDLPDFEDIDYGVCDGVYEVEALYAFLGDSRSFPQYVQDAVTDQYADNGGYTEENVREYLTEMVNLFFPYWTDDKKAETVDQLVIYVMQGRDAISKVGKISKYLECAYDPGAGFSLGEVQVEEIGITEQYETSWEFYTSSIETWYGDIKYDEPIKSIEYRIDETKCTKDEYNQFDEEDLTNYKEKDDVSDIKKVIIYEKRANEAGIEAATIVDTADIYSSLDTLGEDKQSSFQYWTIESLGKISQNDDGDYNKSTGAGSGSDYLYSKYSKINVKEYPETAKYSTTVIEMSTNIPKVSLTKVNNFLALWKNETGKIGNTTYKSDGKLVKYNDIYGGTIAVGDIFESAPEMLFELLEASESTKGLVDIFKYIMYIYTGVDYGITEEAQMEFIFELEGYGTSALWHNDITKEEFVKIVKGYKVPNGTGAYGTLEWGYNKYFIPNAENFYDISTKYGLDPRFIFSIGIHESYYGTSKIANEKGNFFGWNANDSNPYGDASSFYDMSDGIETVCKGLKNYITPGTWQYKKIVEKGYDPTTIEGIGSLYASDPKWAAKVKGLMKTIFNYCPSSKVASNGDFLEVAKSCHDYLRNNNFYYVQGNEIPYPNGTKHTDCSAYVTWVLYEYGYTELKGWQKTTAWFMNKSTMEKKGWKVKSATKAQAGDIVVNNHHMEIYAGDGKFYNAGSTEAMRKEISNSGVGYLNSFTYAITVTPPK